MARENIQFVQNQWLDWSSTEVFSHLKGTKNKILSIDKHTGDFTSLIFYPKNWRGGNVGNFGFNEEFYVVDGEIEFSNIKFPCDYYSLVPNGFERKNFLSEIGAVTLSFFSKDTNSNNYNDSLYKNFDHDIWVPRINAYSNIWPAANNLMAKIDSHSAGMRVCNLSADKINDGHCILVGFPPMWNIPELNILSSAIEIYVLTGNIFISNRGNMHSGAYICLNKGSILDQMASYDSAVLLIKTHKEFFSFDVVRDDFINPLIAIDYNCIIPNSIIDKITSGPYKKV